MKIVVQIALRRKDFLRSLKQTSPWLPPIFPGGSMKLISLVGSPHGEKGNTAKLTKEVLKGAESMGAVNETIVLKGDTVAPCRGCDVCHVKGFCVQKDSFRDIVRKIVDADGLILASPNYIFSVSAQLKAFMDRCCGILHCQNFTGKYGVSVVTSGGGRRKAHHRLYEPFSHFHWRRSGGFGLGYHGFDHGR